MSLRSTCRLQGATWSSCLPASPSLQARSHWCEGGHAGATPENGHKFVLTLAFDRDRAQGVRGRARRDRLRVGRDLRAGGTSRAFGDDASAIWIPLPIETVGPRPLNEPASSGTPTNVITSEPVNGVSSVRL